MAHREQLVPLVATWMLEHGTARWVAMLEPEAVPCAPILSIPESLRHPQVVARGLQVDVQGVPMVAAPMRFDGQRATATARPPLLDEHGDAIRAALAREDAWPASRR